MNHIVFGALVLLVWAALTFQAWKLHTRCKYSSAILMLVGAGLILRLFAASDPHIHEWDERYHGLVAKNLIQDPLEPKLYSDPIVPFEYKDWTRNSIWMHKQPLPLWTMALSMKMLGVNVFALRLPSLILSTIGIFLIYITGNYFFNRSTSFIAAYLFAINGLIIELSSGRITTDHIDTFFLFFIQLGIVLSIYFVRRKQWIYNLLLGITIGFAILTKWLPALILIPIWLVLMVDRFGFDFKFILRNLALVLLSLMIVVYPWQYYIFIAFPDEAQWEAKMSFAHIYSVVEGHHGSYFYYLNRIRINYGEYIYLPLAWFFWVSFKKPIHWKNTGILIYFTIPFVFFSLAETKMQGYILFISPALFLITGAFYTHLKKIRNSRTYKTIALVLQVFIILLPVRYMIERVKPFKEIDRQPQWIEDLRQLDKQSSPKTVLFNYDRPIEAMFFTDLTVYEFYPSTSLLDSLTHKGYSCLINEAEFDKGRSSNAKFVQLTKAP